MSAAMDGWDPYVNSRNNPFVSAIVQVTVGAKRGFAGATLDGLG